MAHFYVIRSKVDKTGDTEKVRFYGVPFIGNRLTTEKISRRICQYCSLTEADVAAALSALSYCIQDAVGDGQSVHLEGIGTFSLSVKSAGVDRPEELTARDVKPKRLCFKADRKLWRKIRNTPMIERK